MYMQVAVASFPGLLPPPRLAHCAYVEDGEGLVPLNVPARSNLNVQERKSIMHLILVILLLLPDNYNVKYCGGS